MFLWFAGSSAVIVWLVFRSPSLDYRMVMFGSLLPLVDGFLGGPGLLHTLVFSVATLGIVMVATRNRRLVRRRWIGLPIGLMLHLLLDGTWARARVFWWPFLGEGLGTEPLPELSHPPVVAVGLEILGVAALVWMYRRFALDDAGRRELFLRSGQLDRAVAGGGT